MTFIAQSVQSKTSASRHQQLVYVLESRKWSEESRHQHRGAAQQSRRCFCNNRKARLRGARKTPPVGAAPDSGAPPAVRPQSRGADRWAHWGETLTVSGGGCSAKDAQRVKGNHRQQQNHFLSCSALLSVSPQRATQDGGSSSVLRLGGIAEVWCEGANRSHDGTPSLRGTAHPRSPLCLSLSLCRVHILLAERSTAMPERCYKNTEQ